MAGADKNGKCKSHEALRSPSRLDRDGVMHMSDLCKVPTDGSPGGGAHARRNADGNVAQPLTRAGQKRGCTAVQPQLVRIGSDMKMRDVYESDSRAS